MSEVEARIRQLTCFDGIERIEPLAGGLSNANYRVVDATGAHVVRFGTDYPFHHVERAREAMTARAAHAAGFAPEVRHVEPGVMVTAFIGARTYDAADVRADIPAIAAASSTLPRDHAAPCLRSGFMFWVFHVIRDYARTLEAGNSRLAGSCRLTSPWRKKWRRCSSRCRSSSATTISFRRTSSRRTTGSG